MSELFETPIWFHFSKNLNYEVKEARIWPNSIEPLTNILESQMLQTIKNLIINSKDSKVVKFGLNFQTQGTLSLVNITDDFYGLWLPANFKSISKIFQNSLTELQQIQINSLSEFINKFHRLRKENPEIFNVFNEILFYPRPWLMDNKTLKSYFRDDLMSLISTNKNIQISDIQHLINLKFNEKQLNTIETIELEMDYIVFNLVYILFESIEDNKIRFNILDSIFKDIQNLNENIGLKMIIKILEILPAKNFEENQLEILNYLLQHENKKFHRHSHYLFGKHYYENKELFKANSHFTEILYFETQMMFDPLNASAHLYIARISKEIANYPRANLHYSFALTFLKSLQDEKLLAVAQTENLNLRILRIVNLLHSGFQQLNSFGAISAENTGVFIEGVARLLRLLATPLSNRQKVISSLDQIIEPTINLLTLHKDSLTDYFGMSSESVLKYLHRLLEKELNSEIIHEVYEMVNVLLKEGSGLIKKITIFMKDGRHIIEFDAVKRYFQIPLDVGSGNDIMFSSAISAVSSFIKEAVKTKKESEIERIDIGSFNINFYTGKYVVFAVFVTKVNLEMNSYILNVMRSFEEKYEEVLKGWLGNLKAFQGILDVLQPLNRFAAETPEL
jgi:hypothetical protein